MNVRKILDWRKLLLYSHRWMGIAFGLLFVSWFVSGIAFMYWGMPQMSARERLDHQKPVDLSAAAISPIDAAQRNDIRPSSLRIEMRGDRPVYRIGSAAVYADSGEAVPVLPVDAGQALDIIRSWVPEHASTVRYDARLEDSDQWTLQSAARSQMPLHRISVGDSADTYYYVAEATGSIAMKTDRTARMKGFLSGVLHWVYFTPFRRHTEAWNQFIVWGGFAGGLMCLLGLAAGVWRLSPSARYRQKHIPSHSPYVGLMRWHHYTGLAFGLVTFTWIVSGAFSVNPFNMFGARGTLSREDREVLTGGPLNIESVTIEQLRGGLAALSSHFLPKEIDVQQFRGRLYMTANRPPAPQDSAVRPGPAEYRMAWLDAPAAGFTSFDRAAIDEIADALKPGVPVEDRAWLDAYDNYYRSRDNTRPLPVLRVRYLDADRTWVYLDPSRGAMTQQGSGSRMNRWLYGALHEFDFPFLYSSRPLWDIVVIVLSAGGIVLSASTLWPMMRRLYRHGRRFTAWASGRGRPRRFPSLAPRTERSRTS